MTALLDIKENLRRIYSRYSMYILPAIKFGVAMIAFIVMNSYIGYSSSVSSPMISILIAILCSVLPGNVLVVIYSIVMILNMYGISQEIAIVTLIIFILMYMVYFRFSSKYGYVMILMPFLMAIKMPFLMPLIIGIALQPAAVVSMAFGVLLFYMMKYGSGEVFLVVNGTSESGLDRMSSFITDLFYNKEMMVLIIAFAVAALVAYGIKRLSVDNSSTIGIITAGVVEAIMILGSLYVLDVGEGTYKLWMIWVFTLVSIIIMLVLQVFILAVDYSGTEYTQFEDDDYYYYVKAVPKIKVTATDVKVKHINVKKARR